MDSHTHLVFAGDRAQEFSMRCGGVSYEEIARNGGGIQTTVNATREATQEELFLQAHHRTQNLSRWGIGGLEVKSGYGLTHESEIRILQVYQKLKKEHPLLRWHTTYLGAHSIPTEFQGRKEQYVDEICTRTIPEVSHLKLADSVDVFWDRGYFDREDTKRIFHAAQSVGLRVRLHADELSDQGGAEFAAEAGALSADHLICVSESGIQALARSTTVANLLPATSLTLGLPPAPARKLLDAGARVGIATDFNPGTAMTQNLWFCASLAAIHFRMTRAEIFAAITYHAAAAMGLEGEEGVLRLGLRTRPTFLPLKRFEEAYYRLAW
jgi:imidazolonepropionase